MKTILKEFIKLQNKVIKCKQFNIKIELKRIADNFKKENKIVILPGIGENKILGCDNFIIRYCNDNRGNLIKLELIEIK